MRKRNLAVVLVLVLLAVSAFLPAGPAVYAETKVETSRITMGGGYSGKGRFNVNDSLTRTTGAVPQRGSRFEVTSSKTVAPQPASVKSWDKY